MSGRDVIFVLGMGRSGTSALTRVLSLCGCTLPDSLKAPNATNPSGFWEPLDALRLNDEFLFRHDASYLDPTLRLQGELTFAPDEIERFVEKIQAFLAGCPLRSPLVIKEPRITALFGFWFRAACQAGLSVKVIVPIRNPQEVAASFAAWVRASPELWHALWLKYNLLAELHSRQLPRVFVEYSSLLTRWRNEVARIAHSLDVALAPDDPAAIDTFLTPDLHRQRRCKEPITMTFGYPWLSDTYTILSDAARDHPVDIAALAEILRVYRACERAFRTALDDSRNKQPARPPADGIMTWRRQSD